jgi:hypothetical protein
MTMLLADSIHIEAMDTETSPPTLDDNAEATDTAMQMTAAAMLPAGSIHLEAVETVELPPMCDINKAANTGAHTVIVM